METADRTPARAAVLRAVGADPAIEDVELDAPREDEVLVEIAAAGVCATDLAAFHGHVALPLPAVLGHEGAGVVRAVGDEVRGLAPGDHVVLTFDSCGACAPCAGGRPAYCRAFHALNHSGVRRDGTTTIAGVHGSFLGQSSFATHAIARERNAVRVPPGRDPADLAPLGCAVQTGAGAVLNVLRPQRGATLAVVGLGAVGLSAVMAARAAGCAEVYGVDPLPERRALAEELGATALEPGARLPRVDCSVEAVGTEEAVRAALACLRSPGVCATLGFRGNPNDVAIDQGHLLFGRTLTGVIEGDADPQAFIPRLLELPVGRLVTRYAFEDVGAALRAAARGEAVKPVLVF